MITGYVIINKETKEFWKNRDNRQVWTSPIASKNSFKHCERLSFRDQDEYKVMKIEIDALDLMEP